VTSFVAQSQHATGGVSPHGIPGGEAPVVQ